MGRVPTKNGWKLVGRKVSSDGEKTKDWKFRSWSLLRLYFDKKSKEKGWDFEVYEYSEKYKWWSRKNLPGEVQSVPTSGVPTCTVNKPKEQGATCDGVKIDRVPAEVKINGPRMWRDEFGYIHCE